MIRVRELLQLEPFEEFELISGAEGLDRTVTSFAVLDYEIESGDFSEFIRGEFVISSLLLVRELADKAAGAVEKLVKRGISALAVRVFDQSEVPREIRALADAAQIPLFAFKKAYVNDIFVCANNYARARERSEFAARKLDELLGVPRGGSSPAALIRDLDPQLLPFCTAAFCLSPQEDAGSSLRLRLMERYSSAEPSYRQAFFPYAGGVLFLVSADDREGAAVPDAFVEQSFREIGFEMQKCRVGVGSTAGGYEEYALAIAEAVRAARLCRLSGKRLMRFEAAGAYRLILAVAEDRSARRFCAEAVGTIEEHDRANASELLGTLCEYVRRRGDVRSTAQALFQHPNTIRYRLKKAASLLGFTEDVYEQLFIVMSVYLLDR